MPKLALGLILGLIAADFVFAADAQLAIDEAIRGGRFSDAEQLLQSQLLHNPNDPEYSFRLAKVLSWQKKYDQAEIIYRDLLLNEPDNADYQLGLAQIHVWSNQPETALPILERARALAPGDPDIWRLHIQALAAMGEGESIQKASELTHQATSIFPDLNWPVIEQQTETVTEKQTEWSGTQLERNFDGPLANQVELGGSYENLTNNLGHWRSEYLSFEHRFNPRQLVYGSVLQTERFAKNDLQLLMGTYQPLNDKFTLNLEGDVSPTSSVIAKNSLMASLQVGLGSGVFLTGGYRHSEYGTGPVEQGFSILESYFADFRLAYTLRATHSFQKTQFGHRFDFSYYYDDISSITLTYNMGAETGGFQGIVYETQYFGLHGRHWLNPKWAVTWDLGHIEQGNTYIREGVMLGIRRAF